MRCSGKLESKNLKQTSASVPPCPATVEPPEIPASPCPTGLNPRRMWSENHSW